MRLIMQGHRNRFELENVVRLFLPQEKVRTEGERLFADEPDVLAGLEKGPSATRVTVRLQADGFDRTREAEVGNDHPSYEAECEFRLADALYRLLEAWTGTRPPWGLVTGVRPVKLLRRLTRELGEDRAVGEMRDRLLVSPEKLELCRRTLHNEDRLLALSRPESFSLYVSVPFCPTRCAYCSFVSHTVERAGKLVEPYVERLAEELEATGRIARELGLRLETVYFGGGTPTSLTAEQLEVLFRAVEAHFDLSALREYTVEAGRPDTVTADKLRTIKDAGATRISINPQTLREDVLQAIGRRHTVAQFYEAFDLARRCGHENINTDLIAGLTGDDPAGFAGTLEGILALSPESVTVHTLSMKRASRLVTEKETGSAGRGAADMVAFAAGRLPEAGYRPYYLYRQSRTADNQENVGWAKPGREGLYNVYIMDETHTILACGAGAVTKLKEPGGEYLERIFNYKFPYEYNARFGDMLRRKEGSAAFYDRYARKPNA